MSRLPLERELEGQLLVEEMVEEVEEEEAKCVPTSARLEEVVL